MFCWDTPPVASLAVSLSEDRGASKIECQCKDQISAHFCTRSSKRKEKGCQASSLAEPWTSSWHSGRQHMSNTGWFRSLEENLTHDRECEGPEARKCDFGVGAQTALSDEYLPHLAPTHPEAGYPDARPVGAQYRRITRTRDIRSRPLQQSSAIPKLINPANKKPSRLMIQSKKNRKQPKINKVVIVQSLVVQVRHQLVHRNLPAEEHEERRQAKVILIK